jgi:HAD superfamily hydrolase (TIGR01484 family)
MSLKTIITDLDGTLLLPDGTLGDKTRKVFQKLYEKGVAVHVATGRPLEGCLSVTEGLHLSDEIAVYNGSQIFNRQKKAMLQNLVLEEELVYRVMCLLETQQVDYFVYHQEAKYMRPGRHADVSVKLGDFFLGVIASDDFENIPLSNCPRIAFLGARS